jgi:hypothetical protein
MRLTWATVVIAVGVLMFFDSPWIFGQSSSAPSSGQTPKKSTSAQSAAQTPQEKDAQKHYRLAVEALKNDDQVTALDELRTAAALAPSNGMIWYNIAVVESKRGDSSAALVHLHKAVVLGLPKNLEGDAKSLETSLKNKNGGVSGAAPAPQPSTSDSGPPLSETLDWINNTLQNNGGYSVMWRWTNPTPSSDIVSQVTSWSMSTAGSCQVTFKLHFQQLSPSVPPSDYTYSLNLSALDPTIQVEDVKMSGPPKESTLMSGGQCFNLPLKATDGKRLIQLVSSFYPNGELSAGLRNEESSLAILRLNVHDPDIAQRLATALTHAITLCGGKKSLF